MPRRFVRKLERFEKRAKVDRQAALDACRNVRMAGGHETVVLTP